MKKLYFRSMVSLMILALAALAVVAQQPEPRHEDLPNFHCVNERLYRGGQPKRGGLKILALLGIKTIVNLRGESEDTHDEEAEAAELGMRYINIPMSSLGRPTEEQVKRAFETFDQSKNGPVFVHCRRGSDRTGAIIAIYRISRDGWTAEQAIDEANRYGMGFVQFRKRDYIRDYYEQHRQQRAGQ